MMEEVNGEKIKESKYQSSKVKKDKSGVGFDVFIEWLVADFDLPYQTNLYSQRRSSLCIDRFFNKCVDFLVTRKCWQDPTHIDGMHTTVLQKGCVNFYIIFS